jgi:hypothetical protein
VITVSLNCSLTAVLNLFPLNLALIRVVYPPAFNVKSSGIEAQSKGK